MLGGDRQPYRSMIGELEDSPHFPHVLRNFQTEFIGHAVVLLGIYKPLIRYLQQLNIPEQEMTDLCSGSGEPAITIFSQSGRFTRLNLT
ncbi:MAG TPA: hypothetical protein VD905_20640, partial [Flavobacteriales bacterium]|nr:hypothetical protein [Flavobacteriales bacterium]